MPPATLLKSIRLLALLGGLALLLTNECQVAFLVVFGSFFLLGLKVQSFSGLSRFFGAAQPPLALFVLGVAFVDFFYLSNSFLLTVAHFLLSVQGIRLLSLRTNRECFGSVLLSSLMMLSASTLSVEWTFFLVLFAFLLAVTWTLMLLTVLQEGDVPEGSLLWRDLRSVLRHATGAAFLVTFGCCALVFVFFPRFNFQGFRGQFLQPVHKTGFTSQVDLGHGGRVFEDNSIVMRVEIDPRDRALWTGYLRGRALESFDGKVWQKYLERSQQVYHQGRGRYFFQNPDGAAKKILRQRIYLESMDSPLLFMHSRAVFLDIDRPFLEKSQDGSLQRRAGDAWRVHYDVDSIPSSLDPSSSVVPAKAGIQVSNPLQRRVQDPDSRFRGNDKLGRKSLEEELLFLPKSVRAELSAFAKDLSAKALTPIARAKAIESGLRSNYQYSLQTNPTPADKDPVVTFLSETRSGHCEYFAAAMCLMLRSQGVPARLATGFLSHEWNSRGNYFIVRMKHAHAWVEAYIEPYGWVGFDPSPRDSSPGVGVNFMGKWAETMDYISLRWNRYILSYDFEKQVEIVRSVTQQSAAISSRMGRWAKFSKKFQIWLGSMKGGSIDSSGQDLRSMGKGDLFAFWGILAMVTAAVIFAAVGWRRHRDRVWFYRPLLRRLEKRIGKKNDSQTLREFISAAREKLGPKTATAQFLSDLYYRLRFDPAARLSSSENASIRRYLAQL